MVAINIKKAINRISDFQVLKDNRFILILFFGLISLLNLGHAEIQPWDEGLFAIRAKSILVHGDWFDQAEHSVGGLYSSTYPPLVPWLMALSSYVLGVNSFAMRLPIAMMSLSSVIFLFLLAKRFIPGYLAVLPSILLTTTLVWQHYSRQAMADVPLVTMFVVSLYAVIRFLESESRSKHLWMILFSAMVFAGMLSKIIKPILPVLFVVVVSIFQFPYKKKIYLISGFLIGILMSLPWYIYMSEQYGQEFTGALLAPHLYSVVENNTRSSGLFYYFNQILVNQAFLIIIPIYTIPLIMHLYRITDHIKKSLIAICLIWFWGVLLIFTYAPTKMPNYSLYFLVPGVVLCGLIISEVVDKSPRWLNTIASLTAIIGLIWGYSLPLRNLAKQILLKNTQLSEVSPNVLIIGIIVVSILVISTLIFLLKFQKFPMRGKLFLIAIAVASFMIVRIISINMHNFPGKKSGAMQAAIAIQEFNSNKFIYLYHFYNNSDVFNPSLNYYLDGWMSGWKKDRSYIPLPLGKNSSDLNIVRKLDKYDKYLVIYYRIEQNPISKVVINDLRQVRPIIEESNNFIVFGMVRHKRQGGVNL